jgi:CelD/BcsL family acetyltransferase involved in cellulose biosynthesis
MTADVQLSEVKSVAAATDPLWESLVASRPSDVFHSPRWMRVLERTYGFSPEAVILTDGRAPRAGLSYCVIDDLMGRRAISMPFSDFCDPLLDDEAQTAQVLEHVQGLQAPLLLRVLHNESVRSDPRFEVVGRARWHAVDLQPSIDEMWERLPGIARRQIAKGERDGVVVRLAEDRQQLRSFFELHLRSRKTKYRLLAQPFSFFEAIWDEFLADGAGMLLLAYHEDRAIAGSLHLEHNGTCYYKFNASDPDHLAAKPNDLLIWRGIVAAKSAGLTALDFGLSAWDQEGLARFKRKYATDEKTITFLRSGPAVEGARIDRTKEHLAAMTELFTDPDVPDGITERAGAALYSLFA